MAFSSHQVSFNYKSQYLPKIAEFHNSSLSQEYVLWFHVSVKYPVRMQIVQCLDKLACYHPDLKIQIVTIQCRLLSFPAMEIIIINVQAVTQFDSSPYDYHTDFWIFKEIRIYSSILTCVYVWFTLTRLYSTVLSK